MVFHPRMMTTRLVFCQLRWACSATSTRFYPTEARWCPPTQKPPRDYVPVEVLGGFASEEADLGRAEDDATGILPAPLGMLCHQHAVP